MDRADQREARGSIVADEDGKLESTGCEQALQIISLVTLPLMLNAAIELGVLRIIAKAAGAGVSAGEIASEIQEKARPGVAGRLDRVLGLLASHSLLKCSLREIGDQGEGRLERIYSLTRTAEYFLVPGDGDGGQGTSSSLAPFLSFGFLPACMRTWPTGKAAILDGDSQFEKVNGMSLFEYASIDPTFNSIFNLSMKGISTLAMEEVLNTYRGFEGLSSLVDVGGGTGKCLNMVVSKYPSIRAINFDQPHVIRDALPYPGVEHVGGDMFASIPGGEAIMIKDILHDWNDECCIKILKNCYEALPKKGKVIVINVLLKEVPDASPASQFVTQMDTLMLMTFGSRERTLKQLEAMSRKSGFSEFRVADTVAHSVWAVMEFHK